MKEKLKPMSQAFVKNALGLDGIINALSRNTAPEPPDPPTPPVPPGPSTLPEYEKYAIIEDDYDHNKALLGFDVNFNPTILKQVKPDPNREFATSIPDELKSYWDEYGSELDTSWVNIYSMQTDSYTGNVCVYGLHIYEEESDIGEGSVTDSWGDSNFPYLTVVFVSKSDAEVFYADSFPEGFAYYGLFSVGAHEILNSNDGTGTGEDCTTDKVLLGFNVYSPGDQWSSPILEPTILKKSHCYEIDFIKIPANKVLDYDNKIADYEGEDPPPPKLGSIWGWSYIKMHTSWAFYLRNNSEIEMQEAMDENGDSGFPTYPTFEQLTPAQAAAIYESMQ